MKPGLPTEKKIYSVSELTREIKDTLEGKFISLWVEGEVSGFKHHHSGHMYFSLKDQNAVLKAVFFQRNNQNIRFDIEDGLQAVCYGRISLYEPRGDYQLYVERMEPKGLGALQLAFEQLKAKLGKEGLFDPERKRPIPEYPRKIGVVTSPTGAAIQDILNIIHRRFSGLHVLISPVKVQGDGASEEIAQAIQEMNQLSDIDVLIVGRGGGSLEDLWAFNEEKVARAIFHSRIPVISAVGHEIDTTIADFVADLRAPTPSAAAELVTRSREELETRLKDLNRRSENAVRGLWRSKKEHLENLLESYAFKQPFALVEQWAQKFDELLRQLGNYMKNVVSLKQTRFRSLAGKLEVLSPLGVLARGYSLTTDQAGNLIKKTGELRKGDRVQTRLSSGTFESEVVRIV